MSERDHNYRSIADVDGYQLEDERIDPRQDGLRARDFDDVLKFSHARNVKARRLFVAGGRENAIDCNRRCDGIEIEDSVLEGGAEAAVVIKGGSRDITLRRVALVGVTGWCDILIGDWSDQSHDKTTRVVLCDVTRRDGKPVRVVVGRGDMPAIVGGNVRVLRWHSYALKAYWWAKYIYVRWMLRHSPPVMHV